MNPDEVLEQAKGVLERNQKDEHTIPAEGLYPHQWLWDSCFIAIGLRHYDLERAKREILSMLRAQWTNGMIPNMIFAEGLNRKADQHAWRSWTNPNAPDGIATSGITQPPMLAEAIVRLGEKMPLAERRTWYQTVYPALLSYHQWLYNERSPHKEGLTLQIHPWETGLDNTPPWMRELHEHEFPFWVRVATTPPFRNIVDFFRRDTKFVAPGQRLSTFEALALYSVQHRLRRKNYDIDRILKHSLFAIEDLTFNSIFIRANQQLKAIAKAINRELPEDLLENIKKTEHALDLLWDAYSEQYYSRSFVTHKLIKEQSIAAFMPLYAGSITKERAAQLVKLLQDEHSFATKYPVPSVPLNSQYFKSHNFWQGPVWINTNWLIADGLRRYGYDELANIIAGKSVELVAKNGFYEYFSPLDGTPAGAKNFSWTAALVVDFLSDNIKIAPQETKVPQDTAKKETAAETATAVS